MGGGGSNRARGRDTGRGTEDMGRVERKERRED